MLLIADRAGIAFLPGGAVCRRAGNDAPGNENEYSDEKYAQEQIIHNTILR
jgi:hypothetical protein